MVTQILYEYLPVMIRNQFIDNTLKYSLSSFDAKHCVALENKYSQTYFFYYRKRIRSKVHYFFHACTWDVGGVYA